MYVILTTAVAYFAMLLSMVLLGTWPNGFRIATQLQKKEVTRGVDTGHATDRKQTDIPISHNAQYLEFSIGLLLTSCILDLSLGNTGPPDPTIPDVNHNHASPLRFVCAAAAGAVIALGNSFIVMAQARIGIIGAMFISSGLGVVITSAINYGIDPAKNDPLLLFLGVAASTIAVTLCAAAYWKKNNDQQQQIGSVVQSNSALEQSSTNQLLTDSKPKIEMHVVRFHETETETSTTSTDSGSQATAIDAPHSTDPKSQDEEATPETPASSGATSQLASGLFYAILSSVFVGCFGALLNLSTSTSRIDSTPLNSYTAHIFFSIAFTGMAALTVAQEQILSGKCGKLRGSLFDELRSMKWQSRCVLWFAGALCSVSNLCILLGGTVAGFAASSAIAQASPLAASGWGLIYWREFDGSSTPTKLLFVSMVSCYCGAIALICVSVK